MASIGAAAYQSDQNGDRRLCRWTVSECYPPHPAAAEMFAFDMVVEAMPENGSAEILVDCRAVRK